MSTHSKVIVQTDTHTHTDMTKTLPLPHMREVTTALNLYGPKRLANDHAH